MIAMPMAGVISMTVLMSHGAIRIITSFLMSAKQVLAVSLLRLFVRYLRNSIVCDLEVIGRDLGSNVKMFIAQESASVTPMATAKSTSTTSYL